VASGPFGLMHAASRERVAMAEASSIPPEIRLASAIRLAVLCFRSVKPAPLMLCMARVNGQRQWLLGLMQEAGSEAIIELIRRTWFASCHRASLCWLFESLSPVYRHVDSHIS